MASRANAGNHDTRFRLLVTHPAFPNLRNAPGRQFFQQSGEEPQEAHTGWGLRHRKTISYRFPSVGNALCGVPRRAGAAHFRGSRNATEGVPYRHTFIFDSVVYCFTAPYLRRAHRFSIGT